MSNSTNSLSGGGIGFFGLLAIVFIVLKLCKVIDWSWWWVLGPLWIPSAIVLVVVIIFFAAEFFWGHRYNRH